MSSSPATRGLLKTLERVRAKSGKLDYSVEMLHEFVQMTFDHDNDLPTHLGSKMNLVKTSRMVLPLLFLALFAFDLGAAGKPGKKLKEQEGDGIVDRYDAHGTEVYRFVPIDKSLRMIKFVPGQLGYKKKKLPKEFEEILATALAEKKKIHFKCEYFDHGPKKTAIGKKIIVLKFADAE